MEHNTLFKLIYTFFLGLVIAIFFGVGIQAFYESPKSPEYPMSKPGMSKTGEYSEQEFAAQQKEQDKFNQEMKSFETTRHSYERNVSILLLIFAVGTVTIGLVFSSRFGFLSDGVLLGGLFTLVHSLIRGSQVSDEKYMFIATSVSLAVVLFLGYRRFVKQPVYIKESKKKLKK